MELFNNFGITVAEQDLLDQYKAPAVERATLKAVPIHHLDTIRGIFHKLGVPVRIRYRGPRHDRGLRLTTLKRDAVGFAVYRLDK